jgi:hypothetical protein
MKRFLVGLLSVGLLAACASPLAKAETPQQALAATVLRAGQLHSAKFDLQGHVNLTFPPQLASMFAQSGTTSGSFALDLTGNGEAQFPDRYHATINAKLAGVSVGSEVISIGSTAYVKNPLTGKWTASTVPGGIASQFSQPDPLSYTQLLANVKSIKDLGDTTLDGTTVHHYQLVPDKAKLEASVKAGSSAKTAQAQAALKQVLDSGTMTVEVWFGKDDHLVRRLMTDADYHLDLSQLMGSIGATAPRSSAVPAGSNIHATAHMVINYHDFDSQVTISIPTIQ